MDKRTEEKKERLLQSLEKGMTMVHVDARRPGVLVPDHLKQEAHLLLNVSYRFDPPDLTIGEWGVRTTLTFSGKRFTVALPWSALYAISSHVTKEFWIYPDDMPPELIEAAKLTAKVPIEETDTPTGKSRGLLREVLAKGQGGGDPAAEAEPAEQPKEGDDPPKPRGRGHLRVVK